MMPVVILIGFEGTKYMLSESTITKLNRNCTCLPTSSLSPVCTTTKTNLRSVAITLSAAGSYFCPLR